ncbi:MAG: hypothetical protein E7048_03055 [Lentisphaerae bacterium]|nr:hypothetical protein [Lentisphaerota bacterium]
MISGGEICPKCFLQLEKNSSGEYCCPRCGTAAGISANEKKTESLLTPGTVFDKYRIVRIVGYGGMAEVYEAQHLLLHQTFALKVIKNFGSEKQSHANKRFLREAKCFHLLEHPNIVRVYDIGCDANTGFLYIAMEFLEGGNLLLEDGKTLPEKELLNIARDIALALTELEKQQMVHRDIKPSNIMRTADGSYKLMDLGIAKTAWEEPAEGYTITLDDVVIGTPAYASPEQCRSPHNVDIRADIYSLGVTLYQLASGVKPYNGITPVETILNVLNTVPRPLAVMSKELSVPFMELIEAMMAKNPDDRPPDAGTLSAMIENVRQGKRCVIRRKRFWKNGLFTGAAFFLLLIIIAVVVVSVRDHRERKRVLTELNHISQIAANEKNSAPAVLPEKIKTPEKEFLIAPFIDTSQPRGLAVRLNESRKILAYLKSPEAKGIAFSEERKKFFSERVRTLENLIRRKNKRKERACRISCSPELHKEIRDCLKNCKEPFRFNKLKAHISNGIMRALQAGEIDPDSLFTDGRNEKRSLTGIALSGFLPWSEEMLKLLIFSGADIDNNLGTPVAFPPGPRETKIWERLTGICVFNGVDNIDTGIHGPLLLSVVNPRHTYLVCRPEKNSIDWNLANFLVDTGTLLDAEDPQGRTALHYAALHNRGELITRMLLAGALSGRHRDQDGNTPYHYAIRNHAASAVAALERFGLSVPVSREDRAQGALLKGIMSNIPLQVEQALDGGASLDYVYCNGLNALQCAVLVKNLQLVKFLMSKGASPRSNAGRISILGIAVCTGAPEILEYLIQKIKLKNMTWQYGQKKLYLPDAILSHYRKDPEKAKPFFSALLRNKWDINMLSPTKKTALQQALSYGDVHPDVVRFLLDSGAEKKGILTHRNPEIRRLLQK